MATTIGLAQSKSSRRGSRGVMKLARLVGRHHGAPVGTQHRGRQFDCPERGVESPSYPRSRGVHLVLGLWASRQH
jgi:hypothetical protein